VAKRKLWSDATILLRGGLQTKPAIGSPEHSISFSIINAASNQPRVILTVDRNQLRPDGELCMWAF
jgi:hypothetical protein